MKDGGAQPVSERMRRAVDALADAATIHQPGAAPRFPIGAIADLRRLAREVEALERAAQAVAARSDSHCE